MIPFAVIDQMRKLTETLYETGEINHASLLASALADIVQATGKPAFYGALPCGVCPFCGEYEALICLASQHYAVCHEHRVYWYIGADYLSLREDTADIVRRNRDLLATYTQILTEQAFPSAVCPCCGHAIVHAAWCITPCHERDDLTWQSAFSMPA